MTKQGIYKNCERCSKAFYEWPYQKDKRRFCSQTCSNKSTNLQQKATKRKNSMRNYTATKKWRYTLVYIEWRDKCIKRDDSKCRHCKKSLSTKQIVVHHIKSWEEYPELRYELNNGMTLCRKCHNIVDERLCVGRNGIK